MSDLAKNSLVEATLWSEVKTMCTLAYPIMGAQLLMLSMVFVDNIMVGPLGSDALAALALATGMFSLTGIIVVGILGAISPMVTHPFGNRDYKIVGEVMRQGWLFAILLSVFLILIMWNAAPILSALGQKPQLISIAMSYLRVMCLTVPANLLFLATRNLTEGTGDSMPGAVIMGMAALLNVPLDYALIHGRAGFPVLGVAGAAWATALLTWFALIALWIYIYRHQKYQKFALWQGPWRFRAPLMKELCRIGLPLGGAVGAEMSFFACSTFVMGTISAEALAAHQVALNAASMIFMIPLGLSFAVSIRIGHHRGVRDQRSVRLAWAAGVYITLVTQTLTAVLFFMFPDWIVKLYSQTDEVAAMAVSLLMIAAFFQLFDGLQVVGMGALRGEKDTAFAFKATMFSFWIVGASVMAVAYYSFDKSMTGIWFGLLTALGVAAVIHHTRMFFCTREPLQK